MARRRRWPETSRTRHWSSAPGSPRSSRPAGSRPRAQPLGALGETSVITPATFQALHVYKGPNVTSFEAAIWGACWSETLCSHFWVEYHWQDLIGYDVILFALGPSPEDHWFKGYYPWKVYIVDPNDPDNLMIPERDAASYENFSRLDPAIRAAPGVNAGA